MTSFVSKIEAIHPRGRQAKTSMKPPAEVDVTRRPGKTFVSKVNFLADSVRDLGRDQDFDTRANQAFMDMETLHFRHLKGDSMMAQIQRAVSAGRVARRYLTELDRLIRNGKLTVPPATLNMIDMTVQDILQEMPTMLDLAEQIKNVREACRKLGMDVQRSVLDEKLSRKP